MRFGWFLVLCLGACEAASEVADVGATAGTDASPEADVHADVEADAQADASEPTDLSVDPGEVTDATEATDVNEVDAIDVSEDVAATETDAGAETLEDTTTPEAVDAACQTCSDRRPVIFVHGINGGPEDFDVMVARFLADGWPADYLVRFRAADPGWTCNVDNAAAIAELVRATKAATCQPRVDIVAHSMGSLSSRYYIKNLGGVGSVNTYVSLGGMHHGLSGPCWAPDFLNVCVWMELCESKPFITQLNADPATPGELHWVSIYGTADDTVPNASSQLEGADNIAIEGAEHSGANGLEQREDVYAEVKRALGYACW